MKREEILERMRVPRHDRTYILGCLHRPLTFHSQQQRAFNLIWALKASGQIKEGQQIAVIGGGLAGVTAAAAAMLCGIRVMLIERNQRLLELQRRNNIRFIHPNLYDWPREGSDDNSTLLPCLNWKSGYAGQVIAEINKQWEEIQRIAKKERLLEVVTNCEIKHVQEDSGEKKVHVCSSLETDRQSHNQWHDAVIIAVGFGLEKALTNHLPAPSYWSNDPLDQLKLDKQGRYRVLVTGCGDGGLTDVLRLRFQDFEHSELHTLFRLAPMRASLSKLVKIDEEAANIKNERWRQQYIHKNYLDLANDCDWERRFDLRKDTWVVLNGPSEHPYDLGASILNRFALFVLRDIVKDPDLHYWPGNLSANDFEISDGGYKVKFKEGNIITFDHVVTRHGTESALEKYLPQVAEQAKSLKNLIGPDPTRERHFPENFYSEKWQRVASSHLTSVDSESFLSAQRSWPAIPEIIGREQELGVIEEALNDTSVRMITLIGPAGIGKSALAVRAMRIVQDNSSDMIFYVDLRMLSGVPSSPDWTREVQNHLLAKKIAEKAARNQWADEKLSDIIVDTLRKRPALLVLDNFPTPAEQDQKNGTASVPDFLTELLKRCSRLRILSTSRVPLTAEPRVIQRECKVGPLSLKRSADTGLLRTPNKSAATDLFVHCAQAVRPRFVMSSDNERDVDQICQNLDGVPLAICIVAAQVRSAKPQELLHKLNQSNSRQRPCDRALDLRYNGFNIPKRKVFCRLSVFAGGCRSDIATEFFKDEFTNPSDLRIFLHELADDDLLERCKDYDGQVRYRMHPTIREYAYERLVKENEQEAVSAWRDFSKTYTTIAEDISRKLRSSDRRSEEWLDAGITEQDNFRAALQWNLRPDANPEEALRLAGELFWFWNFQGFFAEGISWLTLVLISSEGSRDTASKAKALYARGGLRFIRGEYGSGIVDMEESVRIFKILMKAEDLPAEQKARVRCDLAYALIILGVLIMNTEPQKAKEHENDAHRILDEEKDQWGCTLAMTDLARTYLRVRANDEKERMTLDEEAETRFREALKQWETMHDTWGIPLTLNAWGEGLLHAGQYRRASEKLSKALAIQEKVNDVWGHATSMTRLAEALYGIGQFDEARDHFLKALKVLIEVGRKELIADCAEGLGALATRSGEAKRAGFLFGFVKGVREGMQNFSLPDRLESRFQARIKDAEELSKSKGIDFESQRSKGGELAKDKDLWRTLLG